MTIDQVSEAIGRLTADAAAAQRQRAELFKKADETKDTLGEIKTILSTHSVKNAELLEKHDGQIGAVAGDVASLKKTRQRIYIAVAGMGGSGGIVGYVLSRLGIPGGGN